MRPREARQRDQGNDPLAIEFWLSEEQSLVAYPLLLFIGVHAWLN
jgi:hypothetical protein